MVAVSTAVFVLAGLTGGEESLSPSAPAPNGIRLVLERSQGAESCPDEPAIHAAVVERLGLDPFDATGAREIRCTVDRVGDVFHARITFGSGTGRELVSRQTSCVDLGDAIALTLSVAARPLMSTRPRRTETSVAAAVVPAGPDAPIGPAPAESAGAPPASSAAPRVRAVSPPTPALAAQSAPPSGALAAVRLGVTGRVFVYLGGPTLPTAPALVVDSSQVFDEFGATVAMAGDVNGDGFGDFLVRTQGNEATPGRIPTPRILLYFGGTRLHGTPDVILTGGGVGDENMAAAGLGDIDGDGYGDIAFASSDYDADRHTIPPSRVEIHLGGPVMADRADLILLGDAAWDFFGSSIASAGDVNGDGYPDLVVGSHQPGKADVYFGGPAMDALPDLILTSPLMPPEEDLFGFSVAGLGDVNGDGFSDIAVGAPESDAHPRTPGRAYVYFGGTQMQAQPSLTLASSTEGEWFAKIVAPAGDVNGDGFADIAVVTRGLVADFSAVSPTHRRVDLYFGGNSPDDHADITVAAGGPSPAWRGFAAMDLDADGRPDLVIGEWPTDESGIGEVALFAGISDYARPTVVLSTGITGDYFGARIGR